MTNVDALLQVIYASIQESARNNRNFVVVTKLGDLNKWIAARESGVPYTGPAAEIELDLRQQGFEVKVFTSEDDGPNRSGWSGMEIRW
jgi:hypothetical protein